MGGTPRVERILRGVSMKQIQKPFLSILLTICIFVTALPGCRKNAESVTKTGFYFDTVIQITLYDNSKEHLIDDCFNMAGKFEKLVSTTVADSDIDRLNRAGGTPVTVSEETLTLVEKGLSYCTMSQGAFDITIGALTNLWDIKDNPGRLPDQADIDHACSTISYENILIDGNEVTLTNPETQLDLGAIAKGYIADQMKEYLMENGVTQGIINLGGNVLALGPKPDGTAYKIGIQCPFAEDGSSLMTVEVTDRAVVTSGIYQRYFELDGVIYHHILDPNIGYPFQNGLLSVTIICEKSVDGDALSTTCFALGLEKGMALVESLADTEAVFITEDYAVVKSSGMK